MIDRSVLLRLLDHMRWADEQVLEALRAAVETNDTARELYAHLLGAEEVWLSRLEARAAELAVWPELSLEQCADWSRRNATRYRDFVERRFADLGHEVRYRNSAGTEFDSRIIDILLHLALHGAYHRGQVALLLRRSGDTPAPTDYIAFVRGSPAATRADSERAHKKA